VRHHFACADSHGTGWPGGVCGAVQVRREAAAQLVGIVSGPDEATDLLAATNWLDTPSCLSLSLSLFLPMFQFSLARCGVSLVTNPCSTVTRLWACFDTKPDDNVGGGVTVLLLSLHVSAGRRPTGQPSAPRSAASLGSSLAEPRPPEPQASTKALTLSLDKSSLFDWKRELCSLSTILGHVAGGALLHPCSANSSILPTCRFKIQQNSYAQP